MNYIKNILLLSKDAFEREKDYLLIKEKLHNGSPP